MKTITSLLFTGLLLLVLAGCSLQATPVYVEESATRDEILAHTDVMMQDILTGIQNKDYETLSKSFSDQMLDSIKSSDADQIYAYFEPLGSFQKVELENVQDVSNYYAVIYTATFEKKEVTVRVVVNKEDLSVMSGLWFK